MATRVAPLPQWKDLSPERYRQKIEGLVGEIIQEAAHARAQRGTEPLGVEAILVQNRESRPKKMKKSSVPLFQSFQKKVRREMSEAYAAFVAAFREAPERLRTGLKTHFPVGSFPPALPFVEDVQMPAAA